MVEEIVHDLTNREFYCIIKDSKCLLSYDEVPPSSLDINHTFVSPELRNRGIAEKLLLAFIEYAKSAGKKIIPTCSYAEKYFARHTEYKELLKKVP